MAQVGGGTTMALSSSWPLGWAWAGIHKRSCSEGLLTSPTSDSGRHTYTSVRVAGSGQESRPGYTHTPLWSSS
ncbi:hypothetical protein Pcinc_001869 [Petrolisthes cinctipes]|uniref:Uncharacterized protein n=1 Tax=Petrolisthes cinctipes TaxID=88211 RepID=A0AAE1GMK1_PETCI|nr:hypothetical protein Pcinc_001869 [Petrolisthes cinctipes]